MQSVLHEMFDGVCSIWSMEQEKDADGIWRQKEVLTAADVPCHLSFISAGAAQNDGKGSRVRAAAKLFIAPELTVKPGSKVCVRQQQREYCLICSSLAVVYRWHQEIELCLPEDWA